MLKLGWPCQVHGPGQETGQKESLEEPGLTFGESKRVPVTSQSQVSVGKCVRVVRTTTLILYFQNPGSTNANTSFEIYL